MSKMRVRVGRWAIVAVAALLARDAAAQSNALPQTLTTDRILELVDAINGGRSAIAKFVEDRYTSGHSGFASAANLTNYWASVGAELGPISVESFSEITLGPRTLEVYWVRGTTTHFWAGFRLDLEDGPDGRILGNGVLRGTRPSEGPRTAPADAGMDPFDRARLADHMDEWLGRAAAGDHFWGSVAILKDGEAVYEGAFGPADRETGRKATRDTPYRLASVTKMFTGVAIAQLVDQGRLSLDDPLSRFVPEYPSHIADQVTVHHLLTHQSGIELDDDARFNRDIVQARSIEELLATQLSHIERLNRGNYDDFEPLTEFDYTNEGIDLLGVIVERASGMPWDEYLATHIFEPAGMRHTGAHVMDPPAELAVPYSSRDAFGNILEGPPRAVATGSRMGAAFVRPAGTGWSTAADMSRFVGAFLDSTLVSPESYDLMSRPHVVAGHLPGEELHYGYTLNVDRRGGQWVVGHGGGAPGINTQVRWYPDSGWAVIVLSNLDRAANHVSWHIEELIGIR